MGNNLFGHEILTAILNERLEDETDIEVFLRENEGNMIDYRLADYLNQMLFQKDIRVTDVARKAQLDVGYTHQIFSGRKTPSRDKLIAIAFGLGLTDKETQKMLKISGHMELYVKNKRDAIILFSLLHGKTLFDANELLLLHGFQILGNSKE